ncbi:uncharacterized protein TRUGW13939_04772 [Talaromyces rugulosus]|uniref:O-methyltransferase C-terminal domain-containing protein n=1 Tax=Talaromyces rugulosus TaxID=121627 RepID=A0A7H8QUG9_TALRU|nr:uncharacterized protein TRUGW13939_04772 [Talaromyces rugulosus]QKX57654.1 hypothetical protein TRUGW13939_04772 [Talaromyces rugulosus]
MIAISARISVELDIFRHIVNDGPVTSARLAKLCGAEELLIILLLRLLSALHFMEEVAPYTWDATRITRIIATEEIAAGHRMISQLIVPAMQSAPSYLQERGRSCPADPGDGLMQYAFQSKLGTFERISLDSSLLKDFNMFMGNTMGARTYWVDWYPVKTRILDRVEPEKPLIVDVGGGKGHDLLAYNGKFPGTGRLVLQDLQVVMESLGDLDQVITKVTYDFFKEQPIKGARVYFYHHFLHDWSDDYCVRILARAVSAMAIGYSKLLLHEMIVPERRASQFQAQFDLTMMAFNGGLERTEKQWGALLKRAGLDEIKIWHPIDEGGDGIIEAMKH